MNANRSLRTLTQFLLKAQSAAIGRSKLWLCGIAIVIVLALASAAHLQTLLSIDELIDRDFRSYEPLNHLKATFAEKNDLLLVVSAHGRDPRRAELCAINRWIIDEVDGNERFRKIVSVFGIRKSVIENGALRIPTILDIDCREGFGADETVTHAQLERLRSTPWAKILTPKNGNDIALTFYLNDTAVDKRFGDFDVAIVPEIQRSLERAVLAKFPELEARWAGVALHQYYLKEGLDQTNRLNILMPVLLCFLFWVFFANARTGILFVTTIGIATIVIYGAMAAFGCPIDVLANTLALMILLSALEDFLFLIHHQQDGPKPWRQAFRRLLVPGFFTSLTTAIGFASLAASRISTIRRFGAFAAFAALLEWALIFMILPAFLETFPRFRSWLVPAFDRRSKLQGVLQRIAAYRLPRLIGFALMSVYVISAIGLGHLRVNDAPANMFPHDHPVSQSLDYLKKTRGWEAPVSLVFREVLDDGPNRAVETQIGKFPGVDAIESPYGIEDYLVADLPPVEADRMHDLWRHSPAASRLIGRDGTARSILYLAKTDTATIDSLEAEVGRLCPKGECHLAGTLVAYAEFGNRVLATLLESLAVSLFLVSLVIFYLMRATGKRAYVATFLSVMWGPFALVGIFWLFDFPVSYVTCTFASIVVGIAGDNTVQFLFNARAGALGSGLKRQARAAVQVTLMMVGISMLFYGSYFASVRSLATLFVVGFPLTLIGDLWIFRGLLGEKAESEVTLNS